MLRAVGRAFRYPIRGGWRDPKLIREVALGLVAVYVAWFVSRHGTGNPFTPRFGDPAWVGEAAVMGSFGALYLGYQVRVYRDVVREDDPAPDFGEWRGLVSDAARTAVLFGFCVGPPLLASLFAPGFDPPIGRLLYLPWTAGEWLAASSPSTVAVVGVALVGSYVFPALLGGLAETGSLRGALDVDRLRSVLTHPVYAVYWAVAATISVLGLVALAWWIVVVLAGLYVFALLPPILLLALATFFIAAYVGTVVSYLAGHGYALARGYDAVLPPTDERTG